MTRSERLADWLQDFAKGPVTTIEEADKLTAAAAELRRIPQLLQQVQKHKAFVDNLKQQIEEL